MICTQIILNNKIIVYRKACFSFWGHVAKFDFSTVKWEGLKGGIKKKYTRASLTQSWREEGIYFI